MAKKVKLRVARAYQQDVGRGIARLPSWAFRELGIASGDFILIKGEKETVAKAFRLYREDEERNPDIIRMDGDLRRSAGASEGEEVEVLPVKEKKPAKKVVLAPADEESAEILKRLDRDSLREYLLERPLTEGDIITIPVYVPGYFETIGVRAVVSRTDPKGVVFVSEDTKIEVKEKPDKDRSGCVTYEDIGGLKREIELIREMVELPLKHPEVFQRLGIEPPKGVLLYGPPGTGKTLLAKAVACESDAYFISINGPEIVSKYYGESEQNLRKIFEEAEKNAPAIIYIDEIDAIAPKREEVTGETEKRLVAQLLTLMDGLKGRGQVIVIASTNRPDAIDPALRRPGRFDREIEIGLPNREGRKEILHIHTRRMPIDVFYDMEVVKSVVEKLAKDDEEFKKLYEKIKDLKDPKEAEKIAKEMLSPEKFRRLQYELKDVMLDEIADKTHGYTGADLAALAKEAAMIALRRYLPNIKELGEEPLSKEFLEKMRVTKEDFEKALLRVEPSGMREVMVEVPKVRWDDIGGLEDVKEALREAVEWPLKYPKLFEEAGIEPPKGILLFGPPGTGKTLLAKAVATEANANFIPVRGPEILSKWVGESERAIRKIFHRARLVAPSVIFFDEIDAIAPARGTDVNRVTERVVAQLLTEMDGIASLKDVIIMAATNRPDLLDPALLRPGRFDRIIYVPPPDEKAREQIFRVHTRKMKICDDVDFKELAKRTEGYTGADIAAVCKEAGLNAIRRAVREGKGSIKCVSKEDFEEAL
ncbi:MAG: CDC48 family AAA ATPase, partial [Candidatus Diapherotrites archaeon]|nr:CDC48 family AAA ATPase [Candidatus Diapherotrites archaeon]